MQHTSLVWHPQYRVFRITAKDVLLVSAEQQFLLTNHDYPLCYQLDDEKTVDDIVRATRLSADDPTAAALQINQFLKVVQQFKASNLLVLRQEAAKITLTNSAPCQWQSVSDNGYSLLPASFNHSLSPLLSQLVVPPTIKLVLVSSLLHPQLPAALQQKFDNLVLISCQARQVMVSPVLRSQQHFAWLQQRLLHNAPVVKYVYHMSGLASDFPPCVIPSWCQDPQSVQTISTRLNETLSNPLESLMTIATSGEIQTYPLHTQHLDSSDSFAEQLMQPVTLSDAPAIHADDGGFRCIAPDETVKKLMPFINPVVGYLTDISALQPGADKPIENYRCHFFKTPTIPELPNLHTDSFVQVCLGKGVSQSQAQASAICEAIERLNAQFSGDEPRRLAKPEQLDKRYMSFHDLAPYSHNQYQQFANQATADRRCQLQTDILRYRNQPIYWLPTWSLTQAEQVYVPLTCCFANIELALDSSEDSSAAPLFLDHQYGRWHSNGAAAGNTLEEAILQGLLELIERDAVAIWWYNRIERPAFDLSRLEPSVLHKLEQTITADDDPYDFWVLEITHDLRIPVMAAIGKHQDHQGFILGFGCHVIPEVAAQRALTELCQLIPIRDHQPANAKFDFNAIVDQAYLYPAPQPTKPTESKAPSPVGIARKSPKNLKTTIAAIVTKLQQAGLETLVLNYSRAPIPLNTAKVWVPGLCHIWPQLGNQRLYQVPVAMGWLQQHHNEQSINPQNLYI